MLFDRIDRTRQEYNNFKTIIKGDTMKRKNVGIANEQKGFTLIEVLMAITILTVGLLAVATMQVSAIRGNNLSDNVTTALTLAEDKMEYLLGLGYDEPDLDDSVANNTNLSSLTSVDHEELNIDETGTAGGQFRRVWNIADNSPGTNNKAISIIVTWNQNKQRVSISSIKRR